MTINYAPPNYFLLPKTVLNAEKLLGTIVVCGPGYRGIGWPDTPLVRAHAANHKNPARLVLVLETAAFVWGWNWLKDQVVELSTLNGKRHLDPPPLDTVIYEFSIAAAQTVQFAGVMVTDPLRTFYDLLYMPEARFESNGRFAALYLKRKFEISITEVLHELNKNRRPYRNRAYDRAREIFDQM